MLRVGLINHICDTVRLVDISIRWYGNAPLFKQRSSHNGHEPPRIFRYLLKHHYRLY